MKGRVCGRHRVLFAPWCVSWQNLKGKWLRSSWQLYWTLLFPLVRLRCFRYGIHLFNAVSFHCSPPESSSFLCPLSSLSMLLHAAPQCHLPNAVCSFNWTLQIVWVCRSAGIVCLVFIVLVVFVFRFVCLFLFCCCCCCCCCFLFLFVCLCVCVCGCCLFVCLFVCLGVCWLFFFSVCLFVCAFLCVCLFLGFFVTLVHQGCFSVSILQTTLLSF